MCRLGGMGGREGVRAEGLLMSVLWSCEMIRPILQ
jgi:hypothetical protein